jgi:hypothetical protein
LNLTTLRPVTPPLTMPEGPRLMFDRALETISHFEGFEDRINYANELVENLHALAFAAVIDANQHANALRRLRSVLQHDLGIVTAAENFTVFDAAARDEVTA